MTGAELKALRLSQGLSRPKLATLAAVHPHSVKYWEAKETVDLLGWAPKRLLSAIGYFPQAREPRENFPTSARAGGGVLISESRISDSGKCGAKTRRGGHCRARPIPGKTRCKFHGGLSTGPKTTEGKARIAEAQRRRWKGQ